MHKRNGFTIIELLIVIVVIGILATITIVAFSGIQDRARAAQLLSSVDAAEKQLRIYQTINGDWPLWFDPDAGEGFTSVFACLGQASDYPAGDGFEEGECFDGGHPDSTGWHSPYLTGELNSIGNGLTVNSSGNVISEDGVIIRGVLYTISEGDASIMFFLKGDQECGRGEKQTDASAPENLTSCILTLQ